MSALLLRLAGPTQAWDCRRRASAAYDGRHGSQVGPVGLMPTYSAIVGLLGAALGRPRGSDPGVLATLDVLVRVDHSLRNAVKNFWKCVDRSTDHAVESST